MKHFTVAEIQRRRCFRCGVRPGYSEWSICADGNRPHALCVDCDIELNRLVLQWARIPRWRTLLARYVHKIRGIS